MAVGVNGRGLNLIEEDTCDDEEEEGEEGEEDLEGMAPREAKNGQSRLSLYSSLYILGLYPEYLGPFEHVDP